MDTFNTFYTVTQTLPVHWACALMYDDTSGFDPEEQAHYDAYCAYMSRKHHSWHCVDISEDTDFVRYHDAASFGVLACDTAAFMFHVTDA